MAVDARTGVYRQSAVAADVKSSVAPTLEAQAARQQIVGRSVQLPAPLGRLLVRPEAVCQYPTLVWKPCRESLSPFWPFHLFTVGNHQIYIRTDGAVFTALHDQDRGI